jgi:hypothetical protein
VTEVERIDEWRGQTVHDADGERIGKLDEVYYDRDSGEPVLLSIKSGLLGRRATLVPVAGASVGRDYVRVPHGGEQLKRAQGNRPGQVLGAEETRGVADIYGLELPGGAELESASLIEQRRAAEVEARRRADELEQEAYEKADEVKEAHRRADEAARRAGEAEREGELARQAALKARRVAEPREDIPQRPEP